MWLNGGELIYKQNVLGLLAYIIVTSTIIKKGKENTIYKK